MSNTIASMYEVAIRKKIRFDSPRGALTLEQLWDVPLRSRDDFNLDVVAKTANKALKEISEESFVSTRKSPVQTTLELQLDFIKHVIETKLNEETVAKQRESNRAERSRLLEILDSKQEDELKSLSVKELEKRINKLTD